MYEALSRLPKLVKLELLEFEISPPSEKEQKTKIHSLPKVTDLTIVQVHRFLSFKGFIKNGQFRADKYLQMILQRFPAVTSLTIMCRTFFLAFGNAIQEAAQGTQITKCQVFLSGPVRDLGRRYVKRWNYTPSQRAFLNKYPIGRD